MPVNYIQLNPNPQNAVGPYEGAARSILQALRDIAGVGINHQDQVSVGSCWAGAAVQDNQGFNIGNQQYGVVMGNSRFQFLVKRGGLSVQKYDQGQQHQMSLNEIPSHAERVALAFANFHGGLYNFNNQNNPVHAVVYVQLEPCPSCKKWLEGQDYSGNNDNNSRRNPFKNEVQNGSLHLFIYYSFPYNQPGLGQWGQFNQGLRH